MGVVQLELSDSSFGTPHGPLGTFGWAQPVELVWRRCLFNLRSSRLMDVGAASPSVSAASAWDLVVTLQLAACRCRGLHTGGVALCSCVEWGADIYEAHSCAM